MLVDHEAIENAFRNLRIAAAGNGWKPSSLVGGQGLFGEEGRCDADVIEQGAGDLMA